MKSDKYHHGNLKEELIEKGLEYIDKYGTQELARQRRMHISKIKRHFYLKCETTLQISFLQL